MVFSIHFTSSLALFSECSVGILKDTSKQFQSPLKYFRFSVIFFKMSYAALLPNEMWLHAWSYLDSRHLLQQLCLVCKKWADLISKTEQLWKHKCKEELGIELKPGYATWFAYFKENFSNRKLIV